MRMFALPANVLRMAATPGDLTADPERLVTSRNLGPVLALGVIVEEQGDH